MACYTPVVSTPTLTSSWLINVQDDAYSSILQGFRSFTSTRARFPHPPAPVLDITDNFCLQHTLPGLQLSSALLLVSSGLLFSIHVRSGHH
jgi:hypothetical protein